METDTTTADILAQIKKMELTSSVNEGAGATLSIVIPAYNEQFRLPKTVIETIRWCQIHVPCYEIIIVDDGSRDGTLNVARLFSDHDPKVKVIACPHAGKGATVRMGMLNASGKKVLFMDADGATPLGEIPKLMSKIEQGFAVAIGSRVVLDRAATVVNTSLHRKFIGRVFAAIVSLVAVRGYRDTQCGFKMFRCDASREIFSRQKMDGFAFDVEILHIAEKLSMPVTEVPVNWNNQRESRVSLVADSVRMLMDILKIRILHWNT